MQKIQPAKNPSEVTSLPLEKQKPDNFQWWVALLVITAVAAFLRLWQLAENPQLFNLDEMVVGYDAQSIWTTGQDHWGNFLPIHFRAFNNYLPPIANYLDVPFVGLLGMNPFAVRLPFALLGAFTVFITGLLGKRLFGPVAGLIAALLLAFEPWHMNYSRIAFHASLVPLFIACALYYFILSLDNLKADQLNRRKAMLWIAASGVCFGILFMTYFTEKVNAPIFALICFAAAAKTLWKEKGVLAVWIITAIVTASPVILEQVFAWGKLSVRFNEVGILNKVPDWWRLFFQDYFSYYNPSSVFFNGFLDGVDVRPDFVGELLWLEGLLFIPALYFIIRKPLKDVFSQRIVLLGWFFTFQIAASLTIFSPHQVRALNFLPLPELLAGYGAVILWKNLKNNYLRWGVAAALSLLFVVNATVFLTGFFNEASTVYDRAQEQIPANLVLDRAAKDSYQLLQPCDTLWFDSINNQSYIYYLFLSGYSPARFHQDAKVTTDDTYNKFEKVTRFGQVNIGQPDKTNLTQTNLDCRSTNPGKVYWLTRQPSEEWPNTGLTWKTLQTYNTPKGQPFWSLLQLSQS